MFRLKMQYHGRPRSVCLGSKYIAMGGPDRYVQAHNVVPWEPHISVLAQMQFHGSPIPVCLGSKCSAMGGLDWYVLTQNILLYGRPRPVCLGSQYSAMGAQAQCVQAQNVVPWKPHIGAFMLTMQCHGSPISVWFNSNLVPLEAQIGMFRLKIQSHGSPRLVCLGSKCSAMGGPVRYVKAQNMRDLYRCFGSNLVQWKAQTDRFRLKRQCHGRPRPVCLRLHVVQWEAKTIALHLKCSAMGCPDWCVRLKMQCHGRPRSTRLSSTCSATLCPGLHARARIVVLWEAYTVVPEIATQCHSEVKTGPFGIFYTVPMGPMSSGPRPRRQCHKMPRLALLGFPIQCPNQRVETVSLEAQTRDSHTVPLGGKTSHSIYSADRGHGAVCWRLSESAMGGLDPKGFRFVLLTCLL